jgi:hypothetical protein
MAGNASEPPEPDAQPSRAVARRPAQIVQAIALLWISALLGFGGSLSEVSKSQGMLIVSVLVTLVMAGGLSVGIWRGRDWARLLYLILVALSLAAMVGAWGTPERPRVEVALEAVSFVADAGSLFLMFTSPGSSWFRPAAAR